MQSDIQFITAKGWDAFSDIYSKHFQKNLSVFCLTLLNMTRYDDAQTVLDAGCGSGFLHQLMINQKKKDAHLYAFDLSSQMVQRAAARMKRYLNQQIGSLDEITKEEIEKISLNDEIFKKVNYHLSVASVDDLSQYKSEMFDVYVCNLVYQLVSDQSQDKAFAEAFRVLKPGGKIGITVWGDKNNCQALWFLKEIAFKTGLCPVGMQGGRFITNSEQVIKEANKAGFQNILCWQQMTPFDIFDIKNIEYFFNPEMEGIVKKATEEQKKLFYQEVDNFIKEHRAKNLPLPFDCYLLIAEKPI